jgi:hypothetical protein
MIHLLGHVDPYSVRVSVYRNLRTGGWSIKTAQRVGEVPTGKVIAHADACALVDCIFDINHTMLAATVAGTGKRGHKRNVFAWVTGKLADGDQVLAGPRRRVTFHPFERPDFHLEASGQTITEADAVLFDADGRCYA